MKAYLGDKLVVEGSLSVVGAHGYACDRIEIYAKDARWLARLLDTQHYNDVKAIFMQLANRFTENRGEPNG